jgi:hypothetical protein
MLQNPITGILRTAGLVVFMSACVGTTDGGETGETGETDRPLCDPALTLTPSNAFVAPFGWVSFRGEGGTGERVFALESMANGGEIQPLTGVFAAGSTTGVTESVHLTDLGCEGQASATIQIVAPLTVRPEAMTLPKNTPFEWTVSGGSGSVAVSHFQNDSGGTLGEGSGVTGALSGHDILHLIDTETDETVSIRLNVEDNPTYRVYGGQIVIPLGSEFTPTVIGGSGHFETTVLSGDLNVDGTTFLGDVAGSSTLLLSDPYVPSFNVTTSVTVAPPLGVNNGEPGGLGRLQNSALAAGDLNGDGFEDAILGNQELHIGDFNTGGVLIYAGGPDGLESEPIQVLSVSHRNQRYGWAMALNDFNGDGVPDLAITAPYANGTGTQTGSVYLYAGLEEGLFEPEPYQILNGVNAYDRMGWAVDSCDLNGDGLDDLMVTALLAENRSATRVTGSQGGVYVYYGREGPFSDNPDHTIWGQVWDGSMWDGVANMQLGASLVAGDFNGDGGCDLAVGTYNWANDGTGLDGGVFVYSGTDAEPFFHTVFNHPSSNGEFGRSIGAADFDGDGIDELIVGAPRAAEVTTQSGAAYVFWISDHLEDDPTISLESSAADWIYYGESQSDYLGRTLSAADANGDGVPDLILNATQDELAGGFYNTGITRIFDGSIVASQALSSESSYNATGETPMRIFSGDETTARFGQSFTPLGDVNEDGFIDFMAYAATDSSLGPYVGANLYIDGDSGLVSMLDMPIAASGANIGFRLAVFDSDGDGSEDILVGSNTATDPDYGSQSGYVSSHLSLGQGFSVDADEIWQVKSFRAYTRFGTSLSPIGDFNNDGYDDMAFLSRAHRTNDTIALTEPSGCAYKGTGAVFVHLGSAGGLSPVPSFRIHSPTGINYLDSVTGGFDADGDGYDDLVFSARQWNSYNGGFVLVSGREHHNVDGLTGICDGTLILGQEGSEDLGMALAPLGDIDGDGRDEFAVSAKDQSMGTTRQGVIWIVWGTSSPSTALQMTPVGGHKANTYFGLSLAGGADVDGDGTPDLVAGSYEYNVDGRSMGGLWLLPGSHLGTLPKTTVTDNQLPITATVQPAAPNTALNYALFGQQAGADFAVSLALVPSPNVGEPHWVAVGSRYGSTNSPNWGGKAEVFQWLPSVGFDPIAKVIVGTESDGYGSDLGLSLAAGRNESILVIGSPYSHALGLAQGAAFAVKLQPQSTP